MAQHGGYRAPNSPAPVSGPGKLSRRTDQPVRVAPGGDYGSAQEMASLQSNAPLPNDTTVSGAVPPGGGGGGGLDLSSVTPMGAESAYANRPVTDGAATGPGAGTDALNIPQDGPGAAVADFKSLPPQVVQLMIQNSMNGDATPSFKRLVRAVIAASGSPQ